MTTPTKEQIEAAKARARGAETEEEWSTLMKAGGGEAADNACAILLAALEAAEAKNAAANAALLASGVEYQNDGPDRQWYSDGMWIYPGQAVVIVGTELLDAARKEAQP